MKRLGLYIRPRGDGRYRITSEWGWGWISNKQTGLTEEELIAEVTKQVKGTLQEWSKSSSGR